jgi:hypothetical protein
VIDTLQMLKASPESSTRTITIPTDPRTNQEDSEIFMAIPEHPLPTLEKQRNNERA